MAKKKKKGHANSVKAFLQSVTDWDEDINTELRLWHDLAGEEPAPDESQDNRSFDVI